MCGLAGIVHYGNRYNLNPLAKALSINCMVRGTDATGYAYVVQNNIEVRKRAVKADKLCFKIPLHSKSVIIHTRHSTQGNARKNINNHPWTGRTDNATFALAHNGVLYNDNILRKTYPIPEPKIETDSFIAVQLLEYKNRLDFESIKFMAENVLGSYSFSIMDNQSNIYLVKGDSPLSIVHIPELKLYVYASTQDILHKALKSVRLSHFRYKIVSITNGDIVKICTDGNIERSSFDFSDSSLHGFNWWDYGLSSGRSRYIKELKQVAKYAGYTEDDIDALLEIGYTPDEIENYIYNMEGYYV